MPPAQTEEKPGATEGFDFVDPVAKDAAKKPRNEDNVYELVAVLLHLGATPFGGHYIAHIKSRYLLIKTAIFTLLEQSSGIVSMIKKLAKFQQPM